MRYERVEQVVERRLLDKTMLFESAWFDLGRDRLLDLAKTDEEKREIKRAFGVQMERVQAVRHDGRVLIWASLLWPEMKERLPSVGIDPAGDMVIRCDTDAARAEVLRAALEDERALDGNRAQRRAAQAQARRAG
jgi:hypothetical protein